MGRKNRRKKSTVSRRLKINPKKLISKPNNNPTIHSETMPAGCRPVVIMSNDTANQHSETVTVVPMTSKMKKEYLPTHVPVGYVDCPSIEPSMALAEQVTTIGKTALKNNVGRVAEKKIQEIEKAVKVHLGLSTYELG